MVGEKWAGRLTKEEWGLRLSANRKKVLKILWVRNWEGKTIRRRCGLITVKQSGHRIIMAGPHRRGEEMKAEKRRRDGRKWAGKAWERKTLNRAAESKRLLIFIELWADKHRLSLLRQRQLHPCIQQFLPCFGHHCLCRLFQLWKHRFPR